MNMNYWELRTIVSKVIPRMTQLHLSKRKADHVREKGRKSGYQQFNLQKQEWESLQRLLNTEQVSSFVEVSLKAQACPMPLNLDCYDGLKCPYQCKYCFADSFRASLYTAFFDNSKTMGIRHCNPEYYKTELDKLFKVRGKDPHDLRNEIQRSVALEIPMRFGIRFEDFLPMEERKGISLQMLQYLADANYPVMINTKSDLVGKPDYIDALQSNEGGAAVHVTMITSDEALCKKLEPGAPSFERRIAGCKAMVDAGIRVVARIEPALFFLTDEPEHVEEYMKQLKWAGIENITFDTYSYSANNPGIRQNFVNLSLDFDRIFVTGCDSQALGSLLLEKFMDLFREKGFSCSSFDLGNVPTNDQLICCEVGDYYKERGGGFNYGCAVVAARFIWQKGRGGKPVRWSDFEKMVMKRGGFLSETLKEDVKALWNVAGNQAYSMN